MLAVLRSERKTFDIFAGSWLSLIHIFFHTFRREAGSVPLKQQDDGTETENQDDELDETLMGMDYIPYTQQNLSLIHILDILEQCQKWHEESKQHKIIDALEAIPAQERTPEMDSELARAYNLSLIHI